MLDILEDAAITGLVVVTTPEEMPVTETIELVNRLHSDTAVAVAGIVANRVLPEPFGAGEEAIFDALDRDGRAPLVASLGSRVGVVLDAAHLAVQLRRTGAGHLARLRDALSGIPLVYVPELFARSGGRRAVELVAAAIAEER
jgi:anion-transporting  ArsA/GET3 family ATPase